MAIKKIWNRALHLLLALFGLNLFTACYGPAPYAPYFSLTGKVVDEEDKPIEGIRYSSGDDDSFKHTASDGSFYHADFCDAESVPETLTLKFVDIDGPENGGEFEEKSVTVNLREQASKPEPLVVKLSLKK